MAENKIKAIAPSRDEVLSYALGLVRDGILSIDEDGRVWRHANKTKRGIRKVGSKRAESATRKGYLCVTLGMPGTRITRSVYAHVLIWTHRNGPIPDELQVNHKDLNRANNHPTNLELLTGAGNIQHSYANGRTRPWSMATTWRGKPRISTEQIANVLELRRQGLGSHRINKLTGISRSHLECLFKKGGMLCQT